VATEAVLSGEAVETVSAVIGIIRVVSTCRDTHASLLSPLLLTPITVGHSLSYVRSSHLERHLNKLITITLLLCTSMVAAEEEVIEDIWLNCVPRLETWAGYAIESNILVITKNDEFRELSLTTPAVAGYTNSAFLSFDDITSVPVEFFSRGEQGFFIMLGLSTGNSSWSINRIDGIAIFSDKSLDLNTYLRESDCSPISMDGVEQLISEHNQRLAEEKQTIRDSRKF
jgi:hypothetical protein